MINPAAPSLTAAQLLTQIPPEPKAADDAIDVLFRLSLHRYRCALASADDTACCLAC